MKRIRVLIVEDSAVVREHLRRIIGADPRLEVAGLAASGEEALELLDRVSPDVISMDIHLPGMQGLEVTRLIMTRRPTPIVVVSGINMEDLNLTMQALKAGALSVVEKPVASSHQDYDALASRLCTQLVIMSEVKVVRQRGFLPKMDPTPTRSPRAKSSGFRLLGLAASTGGPSALAQVLSGLGPGFPLPVAVVQHMTPGFVNGFADWIGSVCHLPVTVVQSRTVMKPGHVYIAPSDHHLVVHELTADLDDSPPVGSHRPSANCLFSSMAASLGPSAFGVLLTGMGDDGAAGLREIRAAGGMTLAEDESTAVVFGMPAAAAQIGAVCEALPVGSIAPRILELLESRRSL